MSEFDQKLAIAEIESAEIRLACNLRQIAKARDKMALQLYNKKVSGLKARAERIAAQMAREDKAKGKDE